MRLAIRPFASGVAGRVFGLFLVATVIPVSVFGLLASSQVDRALTQRGYDALGEFSRTYGQAVYRRLTSAAQNLEDRGADFSPAGGIWGFSAAWAFEAGEPAALIPAPIRAELRSARTLQRPRLFVVEQQVVVVLPGGGERPILAGILDPGYLWGSVDEFPFATDHCVFQSNTLLFCSRSLSDAAANAIAANPRSAELTWKVGEETWLGASWELFVASGFEADSWRILVMQPASVALASLNSFKATFPYILLLSLIAATLLASFQIRRTLLPLDKLMAGVARFSNREFGHRIALQARGEFSELASAMNGMAGSLDAQFDAMALLAEVDRKILELDGTEWVLEETLQRFRSLVRADFAGVLLLDKDAEFSAQLYSAVDEPAATTRVDRLELNVQDYRWFNEHADGVIVAAEDAPAVVGVVWKERHYAHCQVHRLRLNGKLVGALVLGWQQLPAQQSSVTSLSRDFADRVTVALASSEREAELYRRAHFDPLTGLPNRELLYDRLGQALVQARDRRTDGAGGNVAVLFIDLDRFKDVNDSMGHLAGDGLLVEAGRRLQAMLAESATVSRVGGDEFVIVLPNYRGLEALKETTQAVLRVLAEPFEVEGAPTYISASLGIARYPEDGDTAGELMRKADTAMYEAKTAGRGEGKLFSAQMDVEVQHRANLQQELHRALENDEFHLVYQPQVLLENRTVTGAEALVRWNHPGLGLVSPNDFISVAEDAGLIGQLDDLVMRRAFGQAVAWLEKGVPIDYIAVNVSALYFSGDFAKQVQQRLESAGLPPGMVELELTESVFAQDLAAVAKTMEELREIGVRIAIDDFGTGYSSMSYIQDLVFDALKIDQSFVRKLPGDRQSAAISNAIIAMGRTLGKTVIAEGIETREQLDCLIDMGCIVGQGYLFSRPLAPDEFVAWVGQDVARLAS